VRVSKARGDSRYGPDGYRYGVRFSDGSIRCIWNGRTQAERATEEAARLGVEYPTEVFVVVRQHWSGGDWEPFRQ